GLIGSQNESFSYDLADRRISRTFPDGAVQAFRYDAGGALDRVSIDGTPWATWSSFDPGFRPGRRTLHLPTIDTTYSYDGDGLMTSLETRQTTPTPSWIATQWQTYAFDARGNVRS